MDEAKITKRLAFEKITGKPYPKDTEIVSCRDICANYQGSAEFRERYCCSGKVFQGWTEIGKCSIKGDVHPRDCRAGACLDEKK